MRTTLRYSVLILSVLSHYLLMPGTFSEESLSSTVSRALEIDQEPQHFYVSAEGSDNNDGLSPSKPWQTVAQVNAHAFNPGDFIHFRKGEVFRETLVVSSNGVAGNPITITSYGEGEKPTFSLPLITQWTDQGDGVYRTEMKASNLTGVWEDDIPVQPLASDKRLNNGRWFADAKFLYYRPSSGSASDHRVSTIERIYSFDSGIWVSDREYIAISDLSFKGLPVGVYSRDFGSGTQGIEIRNSEFHYCQSAIFMLPNESGNRQAVVDNCYFYRNHNSIRMYTESALAPGPNVNGEHLNCRITNNESFEDGTIDGDTPWDYGFTDYEVIGLQNFSFGEITDNYIHDGSALGIIFYNLEGMSSDDNEIVRNRIVDNTKVPFFLTGEDSDGAANYSYGGNMISHNVMVGNETSNNSAIWFDQGVKSDHTNYFVHNICVGKYHQIQISRADIPAYLTIQNNIFYGVNYNIWIYGTGPPTELALDYNIYHSTPSAWGWYLDQDTRDLSYMRDLGYGGHSVFADPLFVDVESRDFHLLPSSPAIGAGVVVPGITIDLDGNTVGTRRDVGAYQFDGSISPVDNSELANLLLFPNPVHEILWVKNSPKQESYRISDVWGKLILQGRLNGKKIDVSHLTPGVYHLQLDGVNHRLLKQ